MYQWLRQNKISAGKIFNQDDPTSTHLHLRDNHCEGGPVSLWFPVTTMRPPRGSQNTDIYGLFFCVPGQLLLLLLLLR